jgi:hypothetical protein
MSQVVPRQHPAVVLRTQYVHLRALLIAALVALVALAIAVVLLATSDSSAESASTATPITAPAPSGSTRYDGGPEEGTRGPVTPPGIRYDGPH